VVLDKKIETGMEIPKIVERFYDLAVEYCRWAGSGPSEKEDEVYTALQMVAALYLQALVLPNVDPGEEDIPDMGITKLGSQHVYERFNSLPFQYYREIFHPLAIAESPEEPVIGDIADDLMDIYIDLKEGILLYESGKPVAAVFQWRTAFGFHWGRHATSALRVLHIHAPESEG
jgi:hypothetical protein